MSKFGQLFEVGGKCELDSYNQLVVDMLDAGIADGCNVIDANGRVANCEEDGGGPAAFYIWGGTAHNGVGWIVKMPVQDDSLIHF